MKDAESFDAFYAGTNRRLLHQMYAMTGNLADAQELVQEAYARAWQRWSTYDERRGTPVAWLLGIVADRCRRQRTRGPAGVVELVEHEEPAAVPDIDLERALERSEFTGSIHAMLAFIQIPRRVLSTACHCSF